MARMQRNNRKKPRFRKEGSNGADASQTKFDAALAFHRDGDLSNAMVLYDEILKHNPHHVGALHLSGVICFEEKRMEQAQDYFARGLETAPDFAQLRLSYGVILFELGRAEDALFHYGEAIAIDPGLAEAFYNRANAFMALRQFEEAVIDYSQAFVLEPQNEQCLSNLGDALQALRRFGDALPVYEQAIHINPGYAQAWSNHGLALHGLKRLESAIASLAEAISIDPGLSAFYFNRGNIFRELGRFEEAAGDYARAIRIEPHHAEACSNEGDALQGLYRFEDALIAYERALSIKPDFAEAWSNRGACLKQIRRFEQALASFDQSIELNAVFAEAYWNKALTLLLLGRLEEGWDLYEWRKKTKDPVGGRVFHQPVWTGTEAISNKTLLVHAEQGFGDAIQFSRYLAWLTARGAKVLFAPHPQLRALFGWLDSPCCIVDENDASLSFDYHISLMSLPRALKIDPWNMPAGLAYLHAEDFLVERWKHKIGQTGFKVGICWQGNSGTIDAGRSFPVGLFFQLSQVPGLRLLSLQKGPGEAQLLDLPRGMVVETLGEDFDSGPQAFLDTAAVMNCCDLVITCDTAVAHLAGALGVRTWVPLKYVPDWRWFLDREDSPWYPSMRLFRQETHGDWDGVFARMQAALCIAMRDQN